MKISIFFDHLKDAARQTGRALPDILSTIKSAGIDYVECDLGTVLDPVMLQMIKNAGLAVGGVYHTVDYAHNPDPKIGYCLIDGAAYAGAKNVLCVPGFREAGDDKLQVMQNIAQGLSGLIAYGREKGVPVTMEDFDGKKAPFSTISGMQYFFRACEGLTCAFDTGNFIYSGEDALRAWHFFKPITTHVHLKDRSFTPRPGDKPKTAVDGRELYPAPVGGGEIPIREIVTDLLASGYDDIFAIEHFDSGRMLEDALASAEYLRNF